MKKIKYHHFFLLFFIVSSIVVKAQQNVFIESENQGMGADGPGAPPDFNNENPTVIISQYSEYLILLAIVLIVFLGAKFVKKSKQRTHHQSDKKITKLS